MGYDIRPLQSYHPDQFWLAPKTHNVLLFPTFGRNGCLFPDKINFLILSIPPYASLWSFLAHENFILLFIGVLWSGKFVSVFFIVKCWWNKKSFFTNFDFCENAWWTWSNETSLYVEISRAEMASAIWHQ